MALRDELEQEEKAKPSLIKKAKDLVKAAKEQIKRYQSGKDKPIKTRYTHFNDNSLGGIFSGMIITIAGISGSGKTHVLQELENDIFDKELNPDCDEYVLLRCNWEMTVYKLLLRKLKNKLERTMRHILFNAPKGDELNKFNEVCESEENENIFYLEEPTDPKTWYENVHAFLTENIKKKQVIVTIDHLALVRDLLGNKKKAMDDLVEYINSLKKEFKNVSFVLVSQMNRDIEGRTDVRHLAPKRSDLYNTDTLFQISDLVIVIHNPYKLGHEKYMVVSPKRYSYLIEHMDKPDNKRTNFETYNRIFWHYLKIREIEDMDDIKDIYVERLLPPSLKETIEAEEKQKLMEEIQNEGKNEGINEGTTRLDKLPDDFLEQNEDDDGDDIPF